MVLLIALLGILLGWLLNWASGCLPRFAADDSAPATVSATPPPLALWHWLAPMLPENGFKPRPQWFGLHLAVELGSALILTCLWAQYGLSGPFFLLAGGYAFFLLIAIIDLKYRLVLNVVTYPAIAVVLLAHLALHRQDTLSILLGGGLTFAIFFLTAWLKPGDLGGGDVKLATLIGFAFGFPQVLWALLVGAGLGAAVSVLLLVSRRGGMKSTIPYAPFLCLGAMVALLYNPLWVEGIWF